MSSCQTADEIFSATGVWCVYVSACVDVGNLFFCEETEQPYWPYLFQCLGGLCFEKDQTMAAQKQGGDRGLTGWLS